MDDSERVLPKGNEALPLLETLPVTEASLRRRHARSCSQIVIVACTLSAILSHHRKLSRLQQDDLSAAPYYVRLRLKGEFASTFPRIRPSFNSNFHKKRGQRI